MSDKPIIIGISGDIGSGKDTIARYLADFYRAEVVGVSDAVKRALRLFDDRYRFDQLWGAEKDTPLPWDLSSTPRAELIRFGRALRDTGRDFTSEWLIRTVGRIKNPTRVTYHATAGICQTADERPCPIVAVSGIRLREERAALSQAFGESFFVLRVVRHQPDLPICDDYTSPIGSPDFTVQNSGTREELFDKIDEIVESVGLDFNTDGVRRV